MPPPQDTHYFATGSRPFLLQFPPCVGRLTLTEGDCEKRAVSCTRSISNVSTTIGGVESDFVACGTSDTRQSTQSSCDSGCLPMAGPAPLAPQALHAAYDPAEVREWEPQRFAMLGKVQDAVRNRGQVHRMLDSIDRRYVAVKKMPNDWVCSNHDDFLKQHPLETEWPWQDIGCTTFLNRVGYSYGCSLLGVYRDGEYTSIVTELASEGDLFAWCGGPGSIAPGPAREVILLPLAKQILQGVMKLHEMSLVHRDLSLENILLTSTSDDKPLKIQVIDFGMTSTSRRFRKSVRGKASYQAPELHTEDEYDGFLSDAFAVGVTLYAALVKDYPWLSTRPGGCKCFDYASKHGFRAYVHKRKLRCGVGTVAQHMSEPVIQLLEGLLAFDPAQRTTLGESVWTARRSVWDEPWLVA